MGTYSDPISGETLPPNTPIIDTMFVYKIVADDNGLFLGVRARLTLRGDQQAATRFRKEATAPVYLHTTLRLNLVKHACDAEVDRLDRLDRRSKAAAGCRTRAVAKTSP